MNRLTNVDVAQGIPIAFPLSPEFSKDGSTLCFLYPDNEGKRQVFAVDLLNLESAAAAAVENDEHIIKYDVGSENETSTTVTKSILKIINPIQLIDLSSSSSTTETLSLEERLRCERMRLFTSGIASYEMIYVPGQKQIQRFLIPLHGKIYLYIINSNLNVLETNAVTPPTGIYTLYDGSLGNAIDPHASPDGTVVAFVINNELYIQYIYFQYVIPEGLRPFKPIRMTNNFNLPGVTCAVADFLAQEEMDRYRGFWWSDDSKKIAFVRNDERNVPEFNIQHIGHMDPLHQEKHRYPFAGQINGTTQLFVITVPPIATCRADFKCREMRFLKTLPQQVMMQLMGSITKNGNHIRVNNANNTINSSNGFLTHFVGDEYYLARVGWWPDGSVMAQIQTRDQTILQLLRIDSTTGQRTILLQEKSSIWINLHDSLYNFSQNWKPKAFRTYSTLNAADFYFIWASERSGYRQLYLYYYDAVMKTAECLRKIGSNDNSSRNNSSNDNSSSNNTTNNTSSSNNDVTNDGYVIDTICDVDEENELIYFQSSYTSPLEQHLYSTSFSMVADDGGVTYPDTIEKITTQKGWHNVTVHCKAGLYLDIFSSISQPYRTTLHALNIKISSPVSPSATPRSVMDLNSHKIDIQHNHIHNNSHIHESSNNGISNNHSSSNSLIGMTQPSSSLSSSSSLLTGNSTSTTTATTTANITYVLYNTGPTNATLNRLQSSLTTPVFKTIRSADNTVDLYCVSYSPDPVIYGHGPYPTVVSVYGGPHVQRVQNHWSLTGDLRAQKLCQQGYFVIKCDNRGSYRRGSAFEGALKWDMGNIEIVDQITAVESYCSISSSSSSGVVDGVNSHNQNVNSDNHGNDNNINLLNPSTTTTTSTLSSSSSLNENKVMRDRVGIFGWSYGGYMSAMALCRAPLHFACAVAGAPVTSWDGYDTHYTERYMGMPQTNIQGYHNSSVMTHVPSIQGNLLLIHGSIDENVHFRHTARLIHKLTECRKYYELILFPNERHAPHKIEDRIYMEDRIQKFLKENLMKKNHHDDDDDDKMM